jgi:hypothetical protein
MEGTLNKETDTLNNDPNYARILKLKKWQIEHDYPWSKSLSKSKVHRGMIFLGCSFTWGQGLYYYSNLESLREPPENHYDINLISTSHIKFMERIRYPRLVSEHFNTFDVVCPDNGGSNEGIIEFSKNVIFNKPENYESHYSRLSINNASCDYGDFSHMFFQLTHWQRNHIKIIHNEKVLDIHNFNYKEDMELLDTLNSYLIQNELSIDDFEQKNIENNLKEVKEYLQFIEYKKNIKTYILSWPDYYVPLIENDEWLSSRFISFKYNTQTFKSLEELMDQRERPHLIIATDINSFVDTPKDYHPSRECHYIIAKNIIERIENE